MIEIVAAEFDDTSVSVHYRRHSEQTTHISLARIITVDAVLYPELCEQLNTFLVALVENAQEDVDDPTN